MTATVVDRLYEEFKTLISHLETSGEVSLRITADENLRKSLLLAAASYFEYRIIEHLVNYTNEFTNENIIITSFLRNKAINRQYHSFFDWDKNNANQFFGLFGSIFKKFMEEEIRKDGSLDSSIKAFIEIGRDRNRLVHQDFGTFPLEKTADEIYELYQRALPFVENVPVKLRECLNNKSSN